ncbi:MAG TPA: prolipoprotein diacylglyceryl transferase [Saprospiraceae bacterium]|nr:prolipoprotein diacylglyceryl transferase [Saprospiraceae bacterium]HND88714.1 prolipoprotein diacylglyceryl transferase [Saprospiraceae bacterium]
MHYPLHIPFGSVSLPAHLIFEMLAYTLGYRLYVWQRARTQDRIGDEDRMWIFLGAAAGALLGSHLLGVLEHPAYLAHLDWRIWLGNKTIAGGLLGGLMGVEITKRFIGVRSSSGDLMTYPLLLGMAIGRIGCHLAGLSDSTHGQPSTLPWAFDFGDGIPRHPVNLYEVGWLALLAAGIWLAEKKRTLPDGMRFQIFMVGYLVWRFALEFLKPVWIWPALGLSTIQVAALMGLGYYGWVWTRRTKAASAS